MEETVTLLLTRATRLIWTFRALTIVFRDRRNPNKLKIIILILMIITVIIIIIIIIIIITIIIVISIVIKVLIKVLINNTY